MILKTPLLFMLQLQYIYLVTEAWDRLSTSKFRSQQKLTKKLKTIAQQKGIEKLRQDAYEILSKRLFVAYPKNDTKQTPYKGHPVFTAQHATGTCCRVCLEKCHSIPMGIPINEECQQYVIDMIMYWINKQITN